MKHKKQVLATILASMFCLTACVDTGSSGSDSDSDSSKHSSDSSSIAQEQYIEALRDSNFQEGFAIKGNDQATDGVLPKIELKYGEGAVAWEVGQWGSRFDLSESTPSILPARASLEDQGKRLNVNRFSNELTLEVAGQLEYDTMATSRTMWAHLLIEQVFTDFTAHRLDEFKRLDVSLDFSVTQANKGAIETNDPDGSFPAPHTLPAQFLQYFYVVNRNPNSPGFGNFLWFGLGYLDTREEILTLSYQQDFAGGNAGNYIYCLGADTTLGNEPFKIGKQYQVRIDILPYISDALQKAQQYGFMTNTNLEDCTLTGMNLGWEVVGAWNVTAKMKNLSLKGIFKD